MADKKILVNCSTGEVTEIELTAEEIEQREADRVDSLARQAEMDAANAKTATDKAAAEAKLAALGLTANDLKALGL